MESEAQVLVAALIIAVIYILLKKGEDERCKTCKVVRCRKALKGASND